MEVVFYGGVLDHTGGKKSCEIDDSPTLRELIDKLGGLFGGQFREFLLGDETCFFLINGKGIMMTGGLNTKLHSKDRIEVLPFAEAG